MPALEAAAIIAGVTAGVQLASAAVTAVETLYKAGKLADEIGHDVSSRIFNKSEEAEVHRGHSPKAENKSTEVSMVDKVMKDASTQTPGSQMVMGG